MRLTDSMMSKTYLKNLNSSLKALNDSNTRVAAKRRYMRFSEDPARSLKAMKIRKNLSRISLYKDNLNDAQGILDQYESSISNINEIAREAFAQVMQGTTGTSNNPEVRATVANTLRSFQDSILSAANAKYADDYIFGGEGVGTPPFSISDTGELLYNGQNIDTGTFSDEYRYIDIGMGIDFEGDGSVSQKSAFDVVISGIELLGSGVDSDGVSGNLYNLIGQIADKLENNDLGDIDLYSKKLEELSGNVRLQYVSIGEKSNFITYFKDRLTAEETNAKTKQTELEGLKTEEGIMEFKELEFTYNACLQMGTKILQHSLMDFLR